MATVATVATSAGAGDWLCSGEAPAWELRLAGGTARFSYPAPTEMDLMLETPAENADWPRAFTLIGERDTAILLIDRDACNGGEAARQGMVLTQRAQTPILLAGCCEPIR